MKITALLLLILAVCLLVVLTLYRPNYVDQKALLTEGGLSSWLHYSIEFHPAEGANEARFSAALTNVSPYTLSIGVNDRNFHASFAVKPKTGQEYKVFDKEYRGMLLTSTWSEPVTVLAPSHSITWTVPLTSLIADAGASDLPVTEESLSGCIVSGEMVMGILPKSWGMAPRWVSSNATQKSKPIQIPLKANKADAGKDSIGIPRVLDASRSPSPDSRP